MQKPKKVILLGIDGADPMLMRRFIKEGLLPNLENVEKKSTTTDYMNGVHPTITPPNWASLATGAWPGTHGITCYWNHTTGDPLDEVKYGWNSRLCNAEFIWEAAARIGKKSIVFNYPTAWPPRKNENIMYVDGTGLCVNSRARVDCERFYFCEEGDFAIKETYHEVSQSGAGCIVEGVVDKKKFEVKDDEYEEASANPIGKKAEKLADERIQPQGKRIDEAYTPIKLNSQIKKGKLPVKEAVLPVNKGMQRRYALIVSNNGKHYNQVEIILDKKNEKTVAKASLGEWTDWIYDDFIVEDEKIPVAYKIKVLDLNEDGTKLNLYYSHPIDLSNNKWFFPKDIHKELYDNIGPVLHYSNCGDDALQLETQKLMYKWHSEAIKYLTTNHEWDLLYIHMHAIDTANHWYQNKILEEYSGDNAPYYMNLMRSYYAMSDDFVGDILNIVDEDTLLLIVSDHGGMSKDSECETPLIADPWSIGGKLLENMGYLVVNRENGQPEINWEKTRAIAQRSGYIYVNLKGRDPQGSVELKDYDQLVESIIDDLMCYRDPETGKRPINLAIRKEDMRILGLYGDHIGDIYILLNSSFTRVHGTQLTTSFYKDTSVGCLFMMMGPGVKEGNFLNRPVWATDIVPTICHLLGFPMPKEVEGAILYQALED